MKIYITFGQDHAHTVNGKWFDKDCLAEIECGSEQHGRAKAFEAFGPKFCTSYIDISDMKPEYYRRGIIPLEGDADAGS